MIGDTAGPMLGRLILAQLQAAAFKRERDGLTEHRVPTRNYVFLDEFQNFIGPTTGTIVAETRKYGLSLVLIQQFVGQGVDPDLMHNILTNTPLKITGVGTLSTYEKIAASQQVPRDGFDGLRPRLFHMSRRGGHPFVMQAHGFLASQNERMTREQQFDFAGSQLSKFYRNPSDLKGLGDAGSLTPIPDIPPEDFTPPRATGTSQAAKKLIASVRRALGRNKSSAGPPPAASPKLPEPSKEPEEEYSQETEVSQGVFHSKRKPKFKAP